MNLLGWIISIPTWQIYTKCPMNLLGWIISIPKIIREGNSSEDPPPDGLGIFCAILFDFKNTKAQNFGQNKRDKWALKLID